MNQMANEDLWTTIYSTLYTCGHKGVISRLKVINDGGGDWMIARLAFDAELTAHVTHTVSMATLLG